jgi:hypothetical protein
LSMECGCSEVPELRAHIGFGAHLHNFCMVKCSRATYGSWELG